MDVSASIATSMRLSVLLLFTAPVAGRAPSRVFSWQQNTEVGIVNAESTGVTGVFEGRPVLEDSERDVDPRQRQLLGPSVLAKNDCSSAHWRGASPPTRLLHRLPCLSVVPQHPATSHRLRQAKRTLENK